MVMNDIKSTFWRFLIEVSLISLFVTLINFDIVFMSILGHANQLEIIFLESENTYYKIFTCIYDRSLQTYVTEDHYNKFESFTIEVSF